MAEIAQAALRKFTDEIWRDEIVPTLVEYIRIPNKSPAFDPDWAKHGYMDEAVRLIEALGARSSCRRSGATLEVVRLPGRTPLIFIEVPGATGADTVLLYGHLDKQPEMTGWAEGLGPWTPVLEGDKLYGRGGADDGYAMFGALAALLALQRAERAARARRRADRGLRGKRQLRSAVLHRRIWPTASASRRWSSASTRGCGDYERLWLTTSLRGIVGGTLTVEVLTEGVHSGDASGIVPSSFRIVRQLLSRLEDDRAPARSLPSELARRRSPPTRMRAGEGRRAGAGRCRSTRSSRSSRA